MYPHNIHYNRHFPDVVCRKARKNRQLVEIILMKDEIIHDIEADTINLERMRKIEETPVAADERRMYEACRHIDRAINSVVKRCEAYMLLPSPFAHRISTNHTKGWEEQSLYLALPHNWPPHLIDHLRDCVHNHVVKSAEAQLLLPLLSPSDAYVQFLQLDADNSLDDITAAISERLGPTQITPTLLGL